MQEPWAVDFRCRGTGVDGGCFPRVEELGRDAFTIEYRKVREIAEGIALEQF